MAMKPHGLKHELAVCLQRTRGILQSHATMPHGLKHQLAVCLQRIGGML
eukprot:CAMPEP_0177244602 /NCGR_PEP_ID=MMETSP0367-20130122/50008_1 /TAXON_ID=447022 ORGANISM="Scrippsiella hangoei-like, Strain SHHI-4" /NCGR_SAMPLE_ID=MMETSP0367 /ASSEMBLY_ACC=CAM_ASM_000362 /LENGTH=48 /DNA_ID= /DNA_START= /DNA_END= /DNA_ORIENTATION=